MNFFNLFRKKIQVNLTKKEWEQERKNLKNYFKSTDEIIKQELEMISVITEEKEEEVKEETKVAEVEAEEKANFKIFTIEEIEKVEKELEELKEWEDEISKLPAFLELDEIYYNLYCLYRDKNKFVNKFGTTETSIALDKEIADLESKRKELELKLEEEKKELWNRRFSDSAKQKISNIKSLKDFTVKEVTEAKKEEAEETDPFDEKDIASIFKK